MKPIKKQNSEDSLPTTVNDEVKQYWDTLLLVTPDAYKTESYNIRFYHGTKDSPIISIYRFCNKYVDGGFGVQDEIMFGYENTGGQVNFELDADKNFTKSPSSLSKYVKRFIGEIQELIKVKDSSIYVMGYGTIFESDGEKWIVTDKCRGYKHLPNKTTQLNEAPKQLESPKNKNKYGL